LIRYVRKKKQFLEEDLANFIADRPSLSPSSSQSEPDEKFFGINTAETTLKS
jgi:hypothetical protein